LLYLKQRNIRSTQNLKGHLRPSVPHRQDGGVRITLNGHNSFAIAHIHTKVGSERKPDVPETKIPSNFTSVKIQDGGRPPFEMSSTGMYIDTGQPRLPLRSNFIPTKSKMAATAILKIHFNGHNSIAVAHIHTKFGSERKTEVPETEIPSNFISVKIQDGGRSPFQKHLNGYISAAL